MSKTLCFWQNMPTHHQASWLGALAARPGVQVRVVVASDIPQWRRDCGWSRPDYGDTEIIVAPGKRQFDALCADARAWDVNIFSGTDAYPMVRAAYRQCILGSTAIGLMSEARDWRGIRGALRVVRARIIAKQTKRDDVFVLAMGHLGMRWFEQIGYPVDHIYPFGYFVPQPNEWPIKNEEPFTHSGEVQLIFVGQLIKRKGVDILLRGLAATNCGSWQLRIVGDGPQRLALERLTAALGIARHVSFLGAMENAKAMQYVGISDLLVLPSRWDGWGAVVNEALMRGVPVICSKYCGAADLLAQPWRGSVCGCEDTDELTRMLCVWMDRGVLGEEARRRIMEWSSAIEPDTVAAYVLSVIEAFAGRGGRPAVPWA